MPLAEITDNGLDGDEAVSEGGKSQRLNSVTDLQQ